VFLNRFTEQEKKGFLELALLGVRADDCITTEEVQFVEELRLGLGINEEDFISHILADPKLEDAVKMFETDEARRLAYLELVALTYVDGLYDPAESTFLRGVQLAFGLEDASQQGFHDWARRLMKLREDAQALTQGSWLPSV
jgi:hypothetical protein